MFLLVWQQVWVCPWKDGGPSENYCCNHISIASSLTPSPNFLFPLSISLMFCSVITNRLLLRGVFGLWNSRLSNDFHGKRIVQGENLKTCLREEISDSNRQLMLWLVFLRSPSLFSFPRVRFFWAKYEFLNSF